jgi:hypothetical protein
MNTFAAAHLSPAPAYSLSRICNKYLIIDVVMQGLRLREGLKMMHVPRRSLRKLFIG